MSVVGVSRVSSVGSAITPSSGIHSMLECAAAGGGRTKDRQGVSGRDRRAVPPSGLGCPVSPSLGVAVDTAG